MTHDKEGKISSPCLEAHEEIASSNSGEKEKKN